MKNFAKYSLALLAMFVGLMSFGMMSVPAGVTCIALTQLAAFAVAAPCGALFNAVLTPDQLKEMSDVLTELKGYKELFPQVKELGTAEGGFAAIKGLPALLKIVQGEQQKSADTLKEVQKILLKRGSSSPVARSGAVSDDCARHLGAIALGIGIKRGQITGKNADMGESLFKEIIGAEIKSALTSSDIPLPTEYSGQVVELVGLWGMARKYATVFPLGTGTVKLPKLGTDTTFGLIAGSATVTEKSPTVTNVTFTPEKFGGLVRLPTELEEDSIVPIGQFIARYAARQLAYVEDYQVFRSSGAGSGINGTAEGLCKNVVTNSKTTVSGVLGSPSEFTLAHFRTLRTVPDAAALRTGAYYLHPSFEPLLASFNTSGNKPYNPAAQISGNGANPMTIGPTLDGFPIRWLDVMPVYTTSDALSTVFVLFGDVSYQYLGVRGGIRFDTSLEAGFTTDEILIRALERLTTGLMANGAVGGLITHSA